jgi:hypothetical protein
LEFSNAFRPQTIVQQTEQDLCKLDKLGCRDAYVSEQHGEPA